MARFERYKPHERNPRDWPACEGANVSLVNTAGRRPGQFSVVSGGTRNGRRTVELFYEA
jgi:hypothetical protein